MDDLILAARLFEKGYVPNLEGGGIRNRLWQGGKNLARGLAGRVAQTQPAQALTQVMGEGQEARYGLEGQQATNVPSDSVAANSARVDTSRLAHVAPEPTADATAPENQPANLPQEDTDGDGQLTANDTVGRKTTTEVDQQLNPADGTVASTTTSTKTVDTNHDGVIDEKDAPAPAVNSPDPTTNATPATKPTATQNVAGRQQVANAQKLAETSLGGVGAGVATLGLRPAYGLLQRLRGKKQLANLAAGAGGATNVNMIRADGTEFLDEHWNLQKARMEARERGTTEAIRNAYR